MHSPQVSAFSPARNLRISQATTFESVASPYKSQLSPFASQDSPFKPQVKSSEKRLTASVRSTSTLESSGFLANAEQFETRIKRLDGNIIDNYRQTDDKLKLYEQEVNTLEENVAAETVANQLLNERKDKEVNLVEARLTLELQNGKKQSKESERQILANTESSINALKGDFAHEYKRAEEARDKQTEDITSKISTLQTDIKEEAALREKTQNNIVSTLNQRLTNIREALTSEKKIRQKTEAFLFDKIEEINAALSNQIKNEVVVREETESQMLRLLEETCNRYEETVKVTRRRY